MDAFTLSLGLNSHVWEMLSMCVTAVVHRARAIEFRQQNSEAVGGFFSQIGDLYMVHHLWGELSSHSSLENHSPGTIVLGCLLIYMDLIILHGIILMNACCKTVQHS